MLNAMVDYTRKKERIESDPLCTYVHAQFTRHPEEYADIWNKNEKQEHK